MKSFLRRSFLIVCFLNESIIVNEKKNVQFENDMRMKILMKFFFRNARFLETKKNCVKRASAKTNINCD